MGGKTHIIAFQLVFNNVAKQIAPFLSVLPYRNRYCYSTPLKIHCKLAQGGFGGEITENKTEKSKNVSGPVINELIASVSALLSPLRLLVLRPVH